MAAADQSISLMDGTYFVGRKEILDWVNGVCGLNLTKVEQTCSGAVACQLLDAMYPGKVPMNKVDWSANKDYEYIQNYKILQKCFTNLKIDKHVEVDRLVRGKYQDNLEFMQWFKKFYELNATGQPYDPVSQREKGKGGNIYSNKFGGSSSAPSPTTSVNVVKRKSTPLFSGTSSRTTANRTVAKPPAAPSTLSRGAPSPNNSQEKDKELQELTAANEVLTNENGELRATVEGLEKERDFYFNKLREIEIMLQGLGNVDANPLVQDIFKILYASEEDAAMDDAPDGVAGSQ